MSKLRTAVIGVGYLGKFHGEKLKQLPHSKLIAVCDVDPEKCNSIAKKLKTRAITDYTSLIGQVDAVSIAVPTSLHHKVGKFFLSHGVHVLVEKPIATSLTEAQDLIQTAKQHNAILQVGHLERFNTVVKHVEKSLNNPRFIESVRLAPFKLRGSDVNVVLDVMIHDIDIIQSIVPSKISKISANGASVLSSAIDIANARIEFENGCVANVTASRASLETKRKLRIFQHDAYISLDLDKKKIAIHRKSKQEMFPGIPGIDSFEQVIPQGDALFDELEAFLNAIINKTNPKVTGEEGRQALATAIEITNIVHKKNGTHAAHEFVEA